MRGRLIRICLHGACAAVFSSAVSRAWADTQYNILDLGTLGGATSQAYEINNSGQIVGYSKTATSVNRGFVTSASSAINPSTDALGILSGGTNSYAYSISSNGLIAGSADSSSGDRGFVYSSGTMTALGTLGGNWSYAYSINSSGQVAGASAIKNSPSSATHATLYSGAGKYDLGTINNNAGDSYAQAINSTGTVVGYSNYDVGSYYTDHAFVWTPSVPNGTSGAMTDIGTLGGSYGYAWGINDSGEVVGGAYLASDADYHAFKYLGGIKTDLGTLGASYSEAFGVNSSGVIVGSSDVTAGNSHAFVDINGVMEDLNSLISAGSGWTLQTVRGINDSGRIVGYGVSPSGSVHAFLLTPLLTDCYWNVNASGNWSDSGNWLNGVPNGSGFTANFGSAILAPQTVTLDQSAVVEGMTFNNAYSYTLAGPNTLTLANAVGNVPVTVSNGSHLISAPLYLSASANVNVQALAGIMTLSGNITSSASGGLIKSGPGLLVLSGNNSYSGPTTIVGGTLAVSASANLGSSTNDIGLQGGTLRLDAGITSNRNISLAGGGSVDTAGTDSTFGVLSGIGDFTKLGAGRLTVSALTTSNLDVSAGVLQVKQRSANDGINSITRITGTLSIASGAALDLNDNDLIVNYSGASPFTTIQNLVFSGYRDHIDSAPPESSPPPVRPPAATRCCFYSTMPLPVPPNGPRVPVRH